MYGQYREDLGEFAKFQAQKINKLRKREEKISAQKGLKKNAWKRKITGLLCCTLCMITNTWKYSLRVTLRSLSLHTL